MYSYTYICAHHFTEISLQLYEDELLHALPCAAPPSYTEYRSDAQVIVTGNGNKTLCPYLITCALAQGPSIINGQGPSSVPCNLCKVAALKGESTIMMQE